jgi:hypothetical protein
MSTHFVTVDRDSPMLLPSDLREWVPSNHLVHFLIEAVEQLDLRCAHLNERGSRVEDPVPKPWLNRLLRFLFTAPAKKPWFPSPFGVSLLLVARKR